jgi:Zn finger protein HypA/HybF involved in hydrogenase expression
MTDSRPTSDRKAKTVRAEIDACPASSENISGEHWRWCPQCGHELINEKCKLRCPRCHYFMSCSDFDFAG